ncbi:MAG TPA: hypothetical protein VMW42_01725 [Desulfatiglandales bacterium]|nr:hypothetical protein [Desulfatiglandales bacterium]
MEHIPYRLGEVKPLNNSYLLKEGGLFFGSEGYGCLFFETEEAHPVMPAKVANEVPRATLLE